MKSSLVPKKEQELLRIVKDPTLFAEAMLGHQVWSRQKTFCNRWPTIRGQL
jgi:hypothetical protein